MTETEKTGLCMEGRGPSGNTGEVEKDPVAEIYRVLEVAVKTITEAFANLCERIREAVEKSSNIFLDIRLCLANDNPKWWHLYKHAKKARVRKKYRNLLLQ